MNMVCGSPVLSVVGSHSKFTGELCPHGGHILEGEAKRGVRIEDTLK